MPMETTYEKKDNIRLHVVTGRMEVKDLIEELGKVYSSGDIPVHANVVWDLSGADATGVTGDQLRQLAIFVKSAWKGETDLKAAFIVGSDLVFGMTRMFEQLLDLFAEDSIRIFKSGDEALAWVRE